MDDCRGSTGTRHDYRRARAVRFGQSAPLGERDPQWLALAASQRAVGVRLIELAQQTPAARASTATGRKIVAVRTGLWYRPGSDEVVLPDNPAAEIEQHIQRRTVARPVDARLNSRARRNPDGRDAAAPLAWRESRHGAHQGLADGEHVGPLEEELKPPPVLLVG